MRATRQPARFNAVRCVLALLIFAAGTATANALPGAAWKMANDVPVWKTITLGTYRSINALLEALSSDDCGSTPQVAEAAGLVRTSAAARPAPHCHLGDDAGEIISRPAFHLSRTRQELDLVVVSLIELGFPTEEDVALEDIHARAAMLGYTLCPAEAGPQLRLQYLNQPVREFLHIGMQPIATYAGELTDLTVGNGGAGLLLLGGDGRPNVMFPSITRFVFVRPHPREVH